MKAKKEVLSQNKGVKARLIHGKYPQNKIADINLINRMLTYSAIKIKANTVPLYSTLNPETSSDSPSAKSKGARLVSANAVINHITRRGIKKINTGVINCGNEKLIKFRELIKIAGIKMIRAMVTS